MSDDATIILAKAITDLARAVRDAAMMSLAPRMMVDEELHGPATSYASATASGEMTFHKSNCAALAGKTCDCGMSMRL